MSTELKVEVPTGMHAPVSNQPEEDGTIKEEQQVFIPPSEGVSGKVSQPKNDGTEIVEGYTPLFEAKKTPEPSILLTTP